MRILIGGIVLALLLPRVAIQCLSAMYRQRKIHIYSVEYAGLDLRRTQHRILMINNRPLADVDLWLHYLKGNLNLIGPNKMEFNEALSLDTSERRRFNVAPGIISPHQIKRHSGIAYKPERETSVAFANNASLFRRTQLITIWLIQMLLGSNRAKLKTCSTFTLFGVALKNVAMSDAVDAVMQSLQKRNRSKKISKFAFVNADCGNHFYNDHGYRKILNEFDEVYPDGVGVKMAARMQGLALKEKVNGTDMFPLLCEQLQRQDKSLYLCGASKKVVRKLAENLLDEYPELRIAGYSDGYSYSQKPSELCAKINSSGADLLLVAMGAPRQERWISANETMLEVEAVMGVGGLFDFYSGEVPRAPVWFRELSIEWVWRLIQQPKDKLRRYLIGNPLFLFRSAYSTLTNRSFDALVGSSS